MLAVVQVIRQRSLPQDGGGTLFYVVRIGRRPWVRSFSVNQVPDFEGEKAWFEVDRSKGRWKFRRQVEG